MAMQGNLHDMAVADLIQHNCQDRKTARLAIQHGSQNATLYFADGNVLHAVMDDTQGETVVYQILAWEDGRFMLEPGIAAPAVTITRSWTGLLMEGARQLDEGLLSLDDGHSVQSNNLEANKMAQKLDEVLKEFGQEVPGFLAANVVGMDGLAVAEHVSTNKINGDTISAQLALFIKLVDTSINKIGGGITQETLLTTASSYMLVRFLPERNFFLAVVVDRKTTNLGNLRLMSRLYADRLGRAMPR